MRVLIPFLAIAVAACASGPPEDAATPTPRTVRITDSGGRVTQLATDATATVNVITVEFPADRAWAGLQLVYPDLGLTLSTLDTGARVLGANIRVRGRLGGARLSTYLDCGRTQGAPSADTYDVHLLVETRVQPGELSTSRISTLVEATARPAALAGATVRCATTGALERRIVEEVRTLVHGAAH